MNLVGVIKTRLSGGHIRLEGVLLIICLITAADASFIPLPAQTVLVILILMNPGRLYLFLISAIAGTMLGAMIGYLAGFYLGMDSSGAYSQFMRFLFSVIPGFSVESFNHIKLTFSGLNQKVFIFGSFTPVPYGILALSAGIFKINFPAFLVATLVGQSVKFYLLTLVASKPGQWVINLVRQRYRPFTTGLILLILVSSVCCPGYVF